ncbi:MAG: hypothetical protein IPG54_11275 [Sphingomonadales bacterium]|nr:hypothetical protein [Sphingomonadales bacterium]
MGNQLSTTPDRYGVSQRDYAELNDEFKTRDGQERFMNFLRMMYPNMSDAERERFAEDARVIAAVRSGNATDADRSAYNNMTEGRRDDVSGALGQYQQMDRLNPTSTLTNRSTGKQLVFRQMRRRSIRRLQLGPERIFCQVVTRQQL